MVEIVVEHVDASGGELAVEPLAGGIGIGPALLEVKQRDLERRYRFRPFDARLVVERLDDGTDQTRGADAIGASVDRPFDAVGARHDGFHRFGIFSAEIEDLANLDAAGAQALLRRDITLETHCIVHVLGRGIEAGPRPNVRHQVRIIVNAFVRGGQIDHVAVAENARLAGFCQNDELVREVAADGPRFGRHRNSFEPHARKRAKVSNEHLVVRNSGGSFVDIEGIGVLHQKLATAHHAEAGALLVAEFPLDVI